MNVQSVMNDVLAERQQLLERVHENFDNIDKEKRDRFNDEVILLANGIREDMNVRIDKLESAVSETMTFEEAISAINRLENEVAGILFEYKTAIDNLLEQEIDPRLEELISDRKKAIQSYVLKEEEIDFGEEIKNHSCSKSPFQFRDCRIPTRDEFTNTIHRSETTGGIVEGQLLIKTYLIPLRNHIHKNVAAIKYYMLKAEDEIYESLNEYTQQLLYFSMAEDLEDLSLWFSHTSKSMFDYCPIARDSGVSYKWTWKKMIKELEESEQESDQ